MLIQVLSGIVESAFGGVSQTGGEDDHVSDTDQGPDTTCSSAIVSGTQGDAETSMDEEKLTNTSSDECRVDETGLRTSANNPEDSEHGSGLCEHTAAGLDEHHSSVPDSQSPAKTSRPQSKSDSKELAAVDIVPQDERDPNCTECLTHHPDPTSKDLMMYLHALRYQGPGWEYSTSLPIWADQDWKQT